MVVESKQFSVGEALRFAGETRCLEVGVGAIRAVPRIFREQFGKQPAVMVADTNTLQAAGRAVAEAFRECRQRMVEPFLFEGSGLYAEHGFVAQLESALRKSTAIPVAVGSGTINDLTKLAAHRTGRQYLCVATAASMDGYAAFGASITFQGSKQTFPCPAPVAVVADMSVLCAAPAAMNAWGYADLAAKVPAGADWILADALGIEPIDPQAWGIVQGRLREMLADASGVGAAKAEAIKRLFEGLVLSGFSMQATKTSRPASGAEHQFSHLWDMEHHTHQGRAPSHGSKVGIGTLAITALYERLLETRVDELDIDRCCETWPDQPTWLARAKELFGEGELAAVAERELTAKAVDLATLRTQLRQVRKAWPDLSHRLREQLIPFSTLKEMLRAAGAPTEPEQIGISRERLRESFWRAFCIRRRFTVLDLAARGHLLDAGLDDVFGSGGPWPLARTGQAAADEDVCAPGTP
jgi:glycerol-1-phosphate dehydrogenase [NAD(P)+]